MDSYVKYAISCWGTSRYGRIGFYHDRLFNMVHPDDKEEIMVALALMVTHEEYSDRYRVYPVSKTKEYWQYANAGCCGTNNCQYKCKSGRLYWYGCNYGH